MPLLVSFVLGWLLRILVVASGVVFAAGLAVLFALVLAWWIARALWARLTGKTVAPFVMRMGPRQGFEDMVRRAGAATSRTPRADAVRAGRGAQGVTDVDPK